MGSALRKLRRASAESHADYSKDIPRPVAPWEFSIAKPGEPSVPNEPSVEGAELGRRVAEACDEQEAHDAERFPDRIPRCNDCAARLGTLPNQCLSTIADLLKCAGESLPFYCHKGLKSDDDTPKRLCTGFALLSARMLRVAGLKAKAVG